jgi:prepilin-type N-terminal cleavage/methylation domain-containing protein
VQFNKIPPHARSTLGFTLVEMLVALVLLGVVGSLTMGFIAPLRLTSDSQIESQAASYARNYLEALKSRWGSQDTFINANSNNYGRPTSTEIQLPSGWTITDNQSTWTATQVARPVTVTVTPTAGASKAVTIQTVIARPTQ